MLGSVNLKDIILLPNILSLARVIVLPPTLYYISKGDDYFWYVFVFFVIIILSDMFDGITSRWLNQVTDLGKLLDPLADKIVIICVGITLVLYREFPIWLLVVLAVRDILFISAGSWLLKKREVVVQSNIWGKLTTDFLTVLAGFHVFPKTWGLFDYVYIPLIITCVLIVISTASYTRFFIQNYREKDINI